MNEFVVKSYPLGLRVKMGADTANHLVTVYNDLIHPGNALTRDDDLMTASLRHVIGYDAAVMLLQTGRFYKSLRSYSTRAESPLVLWVNARKLGITAYLDDDALRGDVVARIDDCLSATTEYLHNAMSIVKKADDFSTGGEFGAVGYDDKYLWHRSQGKIDAFQNYRRVMQEKEMAARDPIEWRRREFNRVIEAYTHDRRHYGTKTKKSHIAGFVPPSGGAGISVIAQKRDFELGGIPRRTAEYQ